MRRLKSTFGIFLICACLFGAVWAVWWLTAKPSNPFHVEPDYLADDKSGLYVPPYLQLPTPDGMTIMWETKSQLPGRVEYGLTKELGQEVSDEGRASLHQVRLSGLEAGTHYFYRVRSGDLVSEINRFRTAPVPGTGKWRMAVYGDSRSNPEMHRKVVDQIAKHNVDLIVHTGDIVLDGKNHASWRQQFFGPLQPIAGSVPWVSTIGNHENDADNYFSYMALPGNERHFAFDYANARIVCVDSNGWMEKEGRGDVQKKWMLDHLKQPREATWTFVAFHHPLFSAHRNRSINPLRWDWTPIFLDPANKIDGVLNGHDHFYARNFPMARVGDDPAAAVTFFTTAGGGANLYPIKKRDYIACTESVHHFTLFEFDGEQIQVSAIDITGRVFDRHSLKKGPAAADNLCAYEIEEMKENLRKALGTAKAFQLDEHKHTNFNADHAGQPLMEAGRLPAWTIDSELLVPHTFQVPLKGKFVWSESPGWKVPAKELPFELQPKTKLRIPLKAEVDGLGMGGGPRLTIEFEPGKFRNRTIECYPFKLGGPEVITVPRAEKSGMNISTEHLMQEAPSARLHLLPTAAGGESRPLDQVRLAGDGKSLHVEVRMADPEKKLEIARPKEKSESSKLVVVGDHVRVELNDGAQTRVYAVSNENLVYHTVNDLEKELSWPAVAVGGDGEWTVQMTIPLEGMDLSKLRMNIIHRAKQPLRDYELRPSFSLGSNPDIIPDWKVDTKPEKFARVKFE